MPIFGRYEVIEELHATAAGSVSRAKPVDGRNPAFVVKLFHPTGVEDDELHWETQSFLERVRTQQNLAKLPPPTNWAAIRQHGTTPGGAFYVTDYYPLSARSLIDRKIAVGAEPLHRIATGIADGLAALRASAHRTHGNLKPANVLLNPRGPNLANLSVGLTDPASTAVAAKAGDTADRHALGNLIYQLVIGEPYAGGPIEPSPAWNALGAPADRWRALCTDLLSSEQTADASDASWQSISAALERLKPPPRTRHMPKVHVPKPPRKLLRALAALIVLAALGFGGVIYLEGRARAEFCQDKRAWLGRFAQAAAQPDRRKSWAQDPDLARVVSDVDQAAPASIDCDGPRWNLDPRGYWRTRAALTAARQVTADLTPERWRRLGKIWDRARQFETRGWSQPAEFLASQIAAARPIAGADVAGAIDHLIATDLRLDRDLPPIQAEFNQLLEHAHELEVSGDPALGAFARVLRRSSGAAMQLGDSGFTGRETLTANVALAGQAVSILHGGYSRNIDATRFAGDVTSHLDLQRVTADDLRHWLERLPDYTLQRDAVATATAALRSRLATVSSEIDASHPDATERASIKQDRDKIETDFARFAQSQFIARDLADGVFSSRRTQLESKVDALRSYAHRRNPQEWIKSLPTLATTSDAINGWWEDWRHVLVNSASDMASNGELFAMFRQQTDRLRQLLAELDRVYPRPPADLAAPLLATAKDRRERDLGRLLAEFNPKTSQAIPTTEKAVADGFVAFCADLRGLAKDFPIRRELLTLADRPDEKWHHDKPSFWEDPSVQSLVRNDLKRIGRLQDLKQLARPELSDVATTSTVPEVTLAAWSLLGSKTIAPPWPASIGELDAEQELRQKLTTALKPLKDEAERAAPAKELAAEGPRRWRQFVESASSEAMLQAATEAQAAFGVDAGTIAALSPTQRFNLSLYQVRQSLRGADRSGSGDATARQVIATISKAAADLPSSKPAEGMLKKLQSLEAREPFADRNPGERFTLPIPGAQPPLEFVRVEPSSSRPFYLCTTEVSFGQFAGVTDAANAWEQTKRFRWPAEAGRHDTRRGPRVWEWSQRQSLQMSAPLLWLFPDDDNDYPLPFRISRFNRTALTDEVGGNPSTDHPIQYISAEAALYFAGLCGCRLPTPGEWRDAYNIFEKTVPPERWNLRDQTWETYKRYASAGAGANPRWPDEGIFHPQGDASATGADAHSRPENDGTLFFRRVNGPGGGTFHQLVGNVAEFLCDAPDAFESWPDKGTADGIGKFVAQSSIGLKVIGGSALSPPELPVDKPLPLPRTDTGYADVGLRLAFTAPAHSLAEKLAWALAGQPYLWAQPSPTTKP